MTANLRQPLKLYEKGRAAIHQDGQGDYQIGVLLFFSEQNPEESGVSGIYFMNVFHTGIYVGNGQIMHSQSASDWEKEDGGGVVVIPMSNWLKERLSFIARPDLTK